MAGSAHQSSNGPDLIIFLTHPFHLHRPICPLPLNPPHMLTFWPTCSPQAPAMVTRRRNLTFPPATTTSSTCTSSRSESAHGPGLMIGLSARLPTRAKKPGAVTRESTPIRVRPAPIFERAVARRGTVVSLLMGFSNAGFTLLGIGPRLARTAPAASAGSVSSPTRPISYGSGRAWVVP